MCNVLHLKNLKDLAVKGKVTVVFKENHQISI